MTNSFIKKIETILRDLPIATEISISFTSAVGTNFTGLKRESSGIKYIDNKTAAFEIGSVTKAVTGNVLAQMVTDLKMKLDDRIEPFLRFKLLGSPPITFKQLALHTSGLPRMPQGYDNRVDFIKENPFSNYKEEALINYLSEGLILESAPGAKASYSNLGFALLGYIISKIENKPFPKIVSEKIFHPLAMNNSVFDKKNISTQLRVGLDRKGNPTRCWDGGIFDGSLGMISTAEDLAKFSKKMLNTDDGSVKMQIENRFPARPDVNTCLGWLMVDSDKHDFIIKINGGTAGSASSVFVNQQKQQAFTFCSNIHPDSYMELIEHLCIEAVTSDRIKGS